MKKIAAIFTFFTIIALVSLFNGIFSFNVNLKNANNSGNLIGSIKNTNNPLETKENTEGLVSVTITPLSLREFEVSLNTHSEELNVDLVTSSILTTDQGKIYKPTNWEGDPPAGHHRKGILKFNSIDPKPNFIVIKIENIGGIAERSFKWIF